jgi:hypothetical protein
MSTLEQTIYTNPSIGLTVTAWAYATLNGEWIVRFRRRIDQRVLFDQNCSWSPRGEGGWSHYHWHPVGSHLIPPPALAAVEEWLAGQTLALGGRP